MTKRASHPYSRIAAVCTVASLSVAAAPAWASGFRLPEASIAGLATSNALVANEKLLGAIPYNPAAMAFHDGTNLVAGAMLVQPDLSVDPANGNATSSEGRDNIFVPNFAFTAKLDEQWSWGLVINAPFGLETSWPAGTFGEFQDAATATATPAIAGLHPEHSEIEMINFNPNFAYKLDEDTSLAFGLDFYRIRSVALNTQGADIGGSGNGVGFNLAALRTVGPWSLGASYRSAVDADIDGAVGASPATTEVNFPWMLQVGAKYQPSDRWAVELDVERTGWSRFDVIEIEAPLVPGGRVTSTNAWDDATAYRLGGIYQLSDKTQLRAGYTFDETGQNEEFFSARVPDADRQLLSIGIAHEVGGWTLEGGYMYVKFDDRTVASNTNYTAQIVGTGNTDPNGTNAYNGEYESDVNLFGLGVTKKF